MARGRRATSRRRRWEGTKSVEPADPRARRLMWWGMALFLLGLVTGLFENNLLNPRMGLRLISKG